MKGRTFAEIYGERTGLAPAELNRVLFLRTLYPAARLIAGLVRWLNPRHFIADYEFCEDVGNLRSLEDFSLALGSYLEHPANRGFLRRRLRIRVSARRMLQIVRTVFAPNGRVTAPSAAGNTFEPFDHPGRSP
ncbi:MAG: hypothetical protein PSV13_05320 [Lacunisphaera sp.]|nr:hypothetical protein [Lacunisphaera sp.]